MSWLGVAMRAARAAAQRNAKREAADAAKLAVKRPVARAAKEAGEEVVDKGSHPAARYTVTRRPGAAKAKPKAPARQLALPAPDPKRPTPQLGTGLRQPGGEWMPDIPLTGGINYSPEHAARETWGNTIGRAGEDVQPLQQWWDKTFPRYIKRDFGTENDPIRGLLAEGRGHFPAVSPEQWTDMANQSLYEDPLGFYTVPPHATAGDAITADDLTRSALQEQAPWLARKPVTDPILSLAPGFTSGDDLGFDRILKGMHEATTSPDLPPDLAVRPEQLGRISLPQAAERVGKIDAWRQEEAARKQAASFFDNPAVHTLKDYPDDPQGLRWVEYKTPEPDLTDWTFEQIPEGQYNAGMVRAFNPYGQRFAADGFNTFNDEETARRIAGGGGYSPELEEALRNEGDAMGHCVGGYCDQVASGDTRIFSLRDAAGMPHVTIETRKPWRQWQHKIDEHPELAQLREDYDFGALGADNPGANFADWLKTNQPETHARYPDVFNPSPTILEQIKGKGNAAPVDRYVPYVQDFVKTQGPWDPDMGDLENAQLAQLPDRRLIPYDKYNAIREARNSALGEGQLPLPSPENAYNLSNYPERWQDVQGLFEGYARGGLVVQRRGHQSGCGCAKCGGGLAVQRGGR